MFKGKTHSEESPQDGFARRYGVSRETLERFRCYEALLRKWQGTHNLVSRKSFGEIWERHFEDSAQLVWLAPHGRRWLDMGSGAGFPGMVIAILLAGRGGGDCHLIESRYKKAAFLETVARETGVSVTVHSARIEETGQRALQEKWVPFDVVTARGLAGVDQVFRYARPFMGEKSLGLFFEGGGRKDTERVKEAADLEGLTYRIHPSQTEEGSRILVVERDSGEETWTR